MSPTDGYPRPIDSPELEDESEVAEDTVGTGAVVLSLTKVTEGTALVGSALCVGTAVVL